MKREEEIKKRLFEISTSNFNNFVDSGAYFAGYIDGAQWADANPSEDTIMQIVEAYKLWVSEFYTMPLTEFILKWLKRNESINERNT